MVSKAKEAQEKKVREEEAKAARKVAKAGVNVMRKSWAAEDAARKAWNRQVMQDHKITMKTYEEEKARCKALSCPWMMPKPVCIIKKPVPKPWIVDRSIADVVEREAEDVGDVDDEQVDRGGDGESADDGDQLSD